MSHRLTVRNRQCTRPVNSLLLRHMARALMRDLCPQKEVELGIYLVTTPAIIRLNEQFLHHSGPTDVITFDHSAGRALHGELVICPEQAVRQARRYRTRWEAELVRYLIHGMLHLCGYDDRPTRARRRMKRQEDRLLHALRCQFELSQLAHAADS